MSKASPLSGKHAEIVEVIERYLRELEGDPLTEVGRAGLEPATNGL